VDISQRFLLAALRSVWGEISIITPTPPPLRAALQAKSDAQFSMVQNGAVGVVSGNGHHVSFQKGGGEGGEVSPQQVLDAWVYLVEIFDRSFGDLGGTPTDTAVEAQMETYLRPITGYTNNWMYLSK